MNQTTAAQTGGINPSKLETLWRDAGAWIANNGVEVILAVVVATIIVLILTGIKSLGMKLCRRDRLGSGWPGIVGRVIGRTRLWFMIALAAEMVAGSTEPPVAVAHAIQILFTVAAVWQAALWTRELVLGLIDRRAGHDPDHQTLGSAMGLIRLLVTVALFAIAIVLILDNLGVNVTGLVAGLGIGGIAIGLAAQGIFSDLFAALSIIFDKPFRIGEMVSWDTNTGTVEKIGLKTTRVRLVTGEQLIVSNANLLQKELRNLANLQHRRITQIFGIVYQTPPDVCARIPDMVEEIVARNTRCTFVRCSMSNLGSSSLDYELLFDVQAPDPKDVADIKSDVLIAILTAFNQAGISFAYPTQTTFTAAPDGTLVMPYKP